MIRKRTPSEVRAALLARGIAVGASTEIVLEQPRKETNTMIRKHGLTGLDPKQAQKALDGIDKILAQLFTGYDPEKDRTDAIHACEGAVGGGDAAGDEPPEKKPPMAEPTPMARPIDGSHMRTSAALPALSQRELAVCEKYGVAPAAYARTRDAIRAKSGRRA